MNPPDRRQAWEAPSHTYSRKLLDYQTTRLENYWTIRLPDYQTTGLPDCWNTSQPDYQMYFLKSNTPECFLVFRVLMFYNLCLNLF